uniref:AAA+ ATPase domain-containing protein n=1 Tax=Sinocyclocheilus grahami TaxID=75366 RepID=A0A672M144_SINGR
MLNKHPASEDKEADDAHFISRHNATLINPGPPALYQLKTERKYIDGTNRKVRRWTYGQKDRNKQNKVILMVGETGAGKTTIINTMINYLLGVKFKDQEFSQITEEEEDINESQSHAHQMTVYEVFVEENPTSLTIIDTPGYGNTEGYEKDREISEYLMRLFSDEDGIHYIDAVCFVMKASQNRLSEKEFYIFHSVLSLFGRDIEENIVFLLTYSDAGPPTDALNAIKTAEIPCRRDEREKPVHFLFNNQQKQQRDKQYEHAFRSSWEMGERSLNEFFTLLAEKNRKSVVMTSDVLNERRRLEACVSYLKEQISEKELKTEELNKVKEAIIKNRDKIKKFENFPFTVKTAVKENVSTENEWWWNRNATCCSDCEENCHEHCSDEEPSKCSVMKNNQCTVCTGKCHYSKHVRENKKYVTKTITLTFVDLKQEYEHTGEKPKTSFQKYIFENITKEHKSHMTEFQNKIKIEEKVKSELEKMKNEKSKLLHEAYVTVMNLSEIALKSDSAFTLQHLDFLIPRLKEEGKDEWMKNLEDLRKAGEERKNKGALCHVMEFGGQNIYLFENCSTDKNE